MKPLRRRTFAAALAGSLLPAMAWAKETALPIPASLPGAATAAARRGEPLVLLVSLPGCPYCELVRRNYLLPALREQALPAWQINSTDRRAPLEAFGGGRITAAAQAAAWKIEVTPTVLFLGPQGQELAERLVGIAVPDFYGAYLDDRLTAARKALRAVR